MADKKHFKHGAIKQEQNTQGKNVLASNPIPPQQLQLVAAQLDYRSGKKFSLLMAVVAGGSKAKLLECQRSISSNSNKASYLFIFIYMLPICNRLSIISCY